MYKNFSSGSYSLEHWNLGKLKSHVVIYNDLMVDAQEIITMPAEDFKALIEQYLSDPDIKRGYN